MTILYASLVLFVTMLATTITSLYDRTILLFTSHKTFHLPMDYMPLYGDETLSEYAYTHSNLSC